MIKKTKVILLIIVFSYSPEHVVIKDDKKYLAYVNSFLKVDVYYYDYINFFLIGNKLRLHEYYGSGGYDPLDGTHNNKPLQYYYYDEQGNITDTNDEYYNKGYSNSKVYDKEGNEIANLPDTNNPISTNNNLEEISKYEEVLYEKKINDKTIIRVVNNGYILAQRSIVSVQKTIDGGNTWKEVAFAAEEEHKLHLTSEEIARINAEDDIKIHIVGVNYEEENIYTIDITKAATPTTLFGNDLENRVIGVNLTYEWRRNETEKWTSYRSASPDNTGDKLLQVRIGATGTSLPSDVLEFSFTEDNQQNT